MRRALRLLIVCAIALLGIAFVIPASAEPADAAVHEAEQDAHAVTDYWTAEAMLSAVPIEQMSAGPPGAPADVPDNQASPTGAAPTTGEAWAGDGAVTKTAGRVFFTTNGVRASCSGNAVTSANRSVVITAGHCVKNKGTWNTNWVFVPGYDSGKAPHGEWVARLLMTTPQWDASQNLDYDIGAAVVQPLNGRRLTSVVGDQPIGFNKRRAQDMDAFGYPVASPYNGRELVHCGGRTTVDDALSRDHVLACTMTAGASGGPWFLDFNQATGTGVQASVTSFGYRLRPGYLMGPYFGPVAQALYNRAQSS